MLYIYFFFIVIIFSKNRFFFNLKFLNLIKKLKNINFKLFYWKYINILFILSKNIYFWNNKFYTNIYKLLYNWLFNLLTIIYIKNKISNIF